MTPRLSRSTPGSNWPSWSATRTSGTGSGRNIGLTGSGTLTAALLREGLLDELHLFVFPLLVGSGQRLFGAPGTQLPLKLLASASFPAGVVHLTYAKA